MIVDSVIIIDYLRRKPQAISFLDSLRATNALMTHSAVVAEVPSGARNKREQAIVDDLFGLFHVTPLAQEDVGRSLDLLREYRLSNGVGWLDCLIGATAARTGIPVATLNEKHLAILPGVTVHRPY